MAQPTPPSPERAQAPPSTLISIARARELVVEATGRIPTEHVAIDDALGRVLARELTAAGDVPPFPCSAMDGYAIIAGPSGRRLALAGESRAGTPTQVTVGAETAIRISTGGAVPPGATAVIRQEDTQERDGHVEILAAVEPGQNIRPAGDDIRGGSTVLTAGTRLGPAELGASVGAGVAELEVSRRPTVAVLCTGDELRAPGEPLGPGQIHNSNAPMLVAAAERCGARTEEAQRLADDRQATTAGLARAIEAADLVIVSGGVSVGPHDHVKPALAALGVQELFWGVALQPGKPTWFGITGGTLVFGLPGNPVSAVVTFSLFVAPALATMQGARPAAPMPSQAILASAIRRNRNREQAIRVRLETRDGMAFARPNGPQGSHIVSSLVGADALALVPAGEGEAAAGTVVELTQLVR